MNRGNEVPEEERMFDGAVDANSLTEVGEKVSTDVMSAINNSLIFKCQSTLAA